MLEQPTAPAPTGFDGIQIGIGKDQVRALAAGLEPDLFHVALAGVALEHLADLGRAGEDEAVDVRVPAKRLPRILAKPRHDVQHATGQPRLGGKLGQTQRRKRRLLGRFQHHRIACGQGRRELPGCHVEREVPRHHRADHPKRHAADERDVPPAGRRDLVIELVDRLGMPLEEMRRTGHIDVHRLGNRLAHVERL